MRYRRTDFVGLAVDRASVARTMRDPGIVQGSRKQFPCVLVRTRNYEAVFVGVHDGVNPIAQTQFR